MKLLSEHNVIHCDLKPENILLKQPDRSGIRVIDYGSSCYANEKVYTYIQSRFYRAPEVILGLDYGLPIDMWSTGCILAELYTGKPLFPGENEPDQLACIMQLLGVPSKNYLDRCTRKKQFFGMRKVQGFSVDCINNLIFGRHVRSASKINQFQRQEEETKFINIYRSTQTIHIRQL